MELSYECYSKISQWQRAVQEYGSKAVLERLYDLGNAGFAGVVLVGGSSGDEGDALWNFLDVCGEDGYAWLGEGGHEVDHSDIPRIDGEGYCRGDGEGSGVLEVEEDEERV